MVRVGALRPAQAPWRACWQPVQHAAWLQVALEGGESKDKYYMERKYRSERLNIFIVQTNPLFWYR